MADRNAPPLPDSTAAFIRALPKTETHLHIEGALPFDLLRGVAPGRYGTEPESWAPSYRYADFGSFEAELIDMASAWYRSPDRYHEAALSIFRSLVRDQNVRYVETSFASGMIEAMRLDGAAVAEAIRTAAPPSLEVRVFMGIHHRGYHRETASWIDDSIHWEHLDGLDLHGPEADPLGPWAGALWGRARAAGKMTKAHAGEFSGPSFIRRVLDELGVDRVEHGIRCVEDPSLVVQLAERDVTLDVCPISNLKLGVVESIEAHPIRTLLQSGVRCTVSTDDPLIFGNTLFDEYATLASCLSFSPHELAQVAANGFRVARTDAASIRTYVAEIESVLDAFG